MAMLQYAKALQVYEEENGGTRLELEPQSKELYLDAGLAMYESCLEWMADPRKCGAHPETSPPNDGISSLAVVMCIASMRLEFAEKLKGFGDRYEAKIPLFMAGIKETIDAIRMHVYETASGNRILLESVGKQNGPDLSTPPGRLFSPGHSIEVAWFLIQLAFCANDEDAKTEALDLIEGSLREGWDKSHHGGLFYMMDVLGRPLVDQTVCANAKLWWPHTEALIALTLACAKMKQFDRFMPWLVRVHEFCYRHFSTNLEWVGYLNSANERTSSAMGGNYKGCFHTPRALLMCVQIVRSNCPNAVRES